MNADRREVLTWGVLISCLMAGCSRKTGGESGHARLTGTDTESATHAPTPAPQGSATTTALLRPKASDEDFMQAIATLESADVNADVELALKSGDHRLFGIRGSVLEAPGVQGDRRLLPQGAYVVVVTGTSDVPGTKYQQRFQMLARIYAGKYNPALLSRLH